MLEGSFNIIYDYNLFLNSVIYGIKLNHSPNYMNKIIQLYFILKILYSLRFFFKHLGKCILSIIMMLFIRYFWIIILIKIYSPLIYLFIHIPNCDLYDLVSNANPRSLLTPRQYILIKPASSQGQELHKLDKIHYVDNWFFVFWSKSFISTYIRKFPRLFPWLRSQQ